MANGLLIAPRREEILTTGGQATLRYSKFFEDVADAGNDVEDQVLINTADIELLVTDVGINTLAIDANIDNISDNTTDIGINTTDIATNTADILALNPPVLSVKTDNYTTTTNETVLMNNTLAKTLYLDASPANNQRVTVKRVNSGAVTFSGNGNNIDGSATQAIGTLGTMSVVYSSALSNWYIV